MATIFYCFVGYVAIKRNPSSQKNLRQVTWKEKEKERRIKRNWNRANPSGA
jgi:hypothetical protein